MACSSTSVTVPAGFLCHLHALPVGHEHVAVEAVHVQGDVKGVGEGAWGIYPLPGFHAMAVKAGQFAEEGVISGLGLDDVLRSVIAAWGRSYGQGKCKGGVCAFDVCEALPVERGDLHYTQGGNYQGNS